MRRITIRLCAFLSVMLPVFAALAEVPPDSDAQQKVVELVQRARNLCDTDQPKEAEPLLSEAAEIKPDFADIYRVWGCAYSEEQQWSKAEEKYKKWAELDPGSYKPFEALGDVAYKQNRYADSNRYLAEAKRLNPTRSYIMSYRCHNFVELQQWQEAIAECTEAIALNPKDEYSYGERSRAERALGNTEKADSDARAAGRYGVNFDRGVFLTRTMLPVILGGISLAFIAIGLAVLLGKKPLLISARWMFVLVLMCFAPQFVLPLTMPRTLGDHLEGLAMLSWLLPLVFTVLLIFLWIQMQGYVAFGIVDKSFRKALLSVLDDLRLERQEELSVIRIPQANLNMQVAIQGWTGVGQLRNKGRSGQEVFQQIIEGLTMRFARGDLETNNTTPVFYIVISILLIVFLFVLKRLCAPF
jgi:Tfp pilus assembly protein PilF